MKATAKGTRNGGPVGVHWIFFPVAACSLTTELLPTTAEVTPKALEGDGNTGT